MPRPLAAPCPSVPVMLTLGLLLGCGCGRKDPASCRAVGARVGLLAAADVKAMAPGQARRDAELAAGPLAEVVTRTCEETRWDAAVRTCLVGASDGTAVATCAQALAPAQRLGGLPAK
ncbi:MAG: hypothetical protein KBG28_05085 [Kofleriaceae bacterium]|nr:hypothetical protein [Kofleriaceae bacterium]MBP9203318.1 hypothetical protein [Kofleriaceae bacterium]